VSWGLSPAGVCLMHDPARREQAAAARCAAGATGTLAVIKRNSKFRTLSPAQLGGRPARTLHEQARQVSIMQFAVGTGEADPTTAREFFRGAQTHREFLKLLDHERRLKRVESALKRLKQT